MDFQAWTVNFSKLTAIHDSGFTLKWEGRAQDPSAVFPGRFPKTLNNIEQVRLLRCGVEFIAKSARRTAVADTRESACQRTPSGNFDRVAGNTFSSDRENNREILAANKPSRGVLSLKARSAERA